MTNFSSALRNEILRVARKELKTELTSLRKTVSTQRSDIAALKRDVKNLTSQVKSLLKDATRRAATEKPNLPEVEASTRARRQVKFDAQVLLTKREQLQITQQQMAQLLQASALSVYKWESGKVQPRAAQLDRIQAVLKLGKRKALAALAR
ncbi:helix-turn-helix domain-containing protein [Variovorax sp. HJSM1_2]|uniref:helix-turn-helix domain-containing protein n=1 Tax=Variovorax sp. HJSM1_2 TaxID=3366263 RepID=UPI003BBAF7B1